MTKGFLEHLNPEQREYALSLDEDLPCFYRAEMSLLRMKRLLILASHPGGWHKRYYSQYCVLQRMGLTGWIIGTAYLTQEGEKKLEQLRNAG